MPEFISGIFLLENPRNKFDFQNKNRTFVLTICNDLID